MEWLTALYPSDYRGQQIQIGGSTNKVSHTGRVTFAHLARHRIQKLKGNLDNHALKVGLTKSFFRKGIKNLVNAGWLSEDEAPREGRGRPSKHYRISRQNYTNASATLSTWQQELTSKLMFPNDKRIPNHADMVQLLLVFSSNQLGFISNLSYSDIADRCGISITGVKIQLKRLEKDRILKRYPGYATKRINGQSVRIKTVYQLLHFGSLPEDFKRASSITILDDHLKEELLFFSPSSKYNPWPECWPGTFRKIFPLPSQELSDMFTKHYEEFVRITTGHQLDNLTARMISAAEVVLSNQRWRITIEQALKEAISKSSRAKLIDARVQVAMINRILEDPLSGVHCSSKDMLKSVNPLLEGVQTDEEEKQLTAPQVISAFLSILSLRMAAFLVDRG